MARKTSTKKMQAGSRKRQASKAAKRDKKTAQLPPKVSKSQGKLADLRGANLQEALRQLERYQLLAMTAALSFLLLTWRWPWAGERLVDPPVPVPPADPINVGPLPFDLSISLAALLLFSLYFTTSCMSAFLVRRARELAKSLLDLDPKVLQAIMTFPSLAAHQSRPLRVMSACFIVALVYVSFAREFW